MPSQTAGRNLPYPLGTDRLMDGDDAIRKLAQSVDNMVQAGRITIPITTAGVAATGTFTFPVPFTAAPIVVATLIGAAAFAGNPLISVQTANASNTTINGQRATGTATFDVFVIAIGPVTAVT